MKILLLKSAIKQPVFFSTRSQEISTRVSAKFQATDLIY